MRFFGKKREFPKNQITDENEQNRKVVGLFVKKIDLNQKFVKFMGLL